MIDNLVSCLARFSKRSMSQGVGKRKAFILRWAQDKGCMGIGCEIIYHVQIEELELLLRCSVFVLPKMSV